MVTGALPVGAVGTVTTLAIDLPGYSQLLALTSLLVWGSGAPQSGKRSRRRRAAEPHFLQARLISIRILDAQDNTDHRVILPTQTS